ncbi:unnamed protein product [Rotaria socialis]
MIVSLCLGCGSFLFTLNNRDPNITARAFCKIRIYIMQSTFMMSRWKITIACLDRYALSSRNVRVRRFAQVKVAQRAVAVVIDVWLILPFHTLVFYKIREAADICAIVYNHTAALYHSIYTIATCGITPPTIMITCTVLIRHNLAIKRDFREQPANATNPTDPSSTNTHFQRTRDKNALPMLFIQVIVYCFVQALQLIYTLYAAIASNIQNKSSDHLANERFASFLADLCVYLFPVTAFYLFILVLRTFRTELHNLVSKMLTICFGNRWNIRIVQIGNVTNSSKLPDGTNMAATGLPRRIQAVNGLVGELR